MFYNSFNLEYINLYNFNESSLNQFNNMFEGIPINVIICINENNIENLIQELSNLNCYIIDCSDNWKSKQQKIINNTNECIINCYKNKNNFKYEYNGKCVENCPNGVFSDDKNKCK